MDRRVAMKMGYHEQVLACCAICKFASYSKTMCEKAKELAWNVGNASVCPTGVCHHFELRDASQDKEYESDEELF